MAFQLLGVNKGGFADILMYQSIPALLHIGNSATSWSLGGSAFNHPLQFQVSYMLPTPALVPIVLSKFLAECYRSIQTSNSQHVLFDGGSLTFTVFHCFQYFGRHSLLVSCGKEFLQG